MGKRKYIVMVVVFWVSEVLIRVVARLDFHIRRWTPILESYALFFHANGRDGEWDTRLGLGNPAADKLLKDYLRLVTAEQLQARVTPKQATPFFVDKLTQLSLHLQTKLTTEALSPMQRFIVARDQAYFKCVFFSGDRPADLGRVKVQEILRFPNDDGLLFNQVLGEDLKGWG